MMLLLIPRRSDKESVRLWAAALTDGTPPGDVPLALQPDGRPVLLAADRWRRILAGGAISPAAQRAFVQVAEVTGLRPGTAYQVRPASAGTSPVGPAARFSTLPESLPPRDGRPLTVLHSSCFFRGSDAEGLVGRAVARLPEDVQPDIKILCGDQVYLDLPLLTRFPEDRRLLGERFLNTYLQTFFQRAGFAELLVRGATWSIADDHEFWNNFPNWAPLIAGTWTEGSRARWQEIALDLYRDFQTDEPAQAGRPQSFVAGRLAFFVADTRVFREEGDQRFMPDNDLLQLAAWIRSLGGPGVLVLGQPLFDTPSTWTRRRLKDRFLPDYEQYTALVEAIAQTRHSLLVLTGDVHFGRVATCEIGPAAGRPLRIVEVISSPSALVTRLAGGHAADAPALYPYGPGPVARRPVVTRYTTAEDHFATLQFYERGGRAEVQVRYWFPKSPQFGSTRSATLPPIELE